MKKRWKMYVLGAVIFFPLATWFFTPAGFQSLWFQLLVSAAYGTFVALYRPTGYTAMISTILAGLAIQAPASLALVLARNTAERRAEFADTWGTELELSK